MSKRIDMTGWVMKEHGVPDSRLTVLYKANDYVRPNGRHETMYHCKCECGNECDVLSYLLKRKNSPTKSCGCYKVDVGKNKRSDEIKEIITLHGSFADNNDELMHDWDWAKNNEAEINPHAITNYSGIKMFWKCKKCKHEWKAAVNKRVAGSKCPVCSGKIVGNAPEYKNSIWASDHREYFSKYLTEEQMKRYMPYSHKKVSAKCPDCEEFKDIAIYNLLYQGLGCKCFDGRSYPNKFIYSLLEQLDIEYVNEYSPDWANKRSYDIYIPEFQCIIENNGMQHYKESHGSWKERTLEEEQENDTYKEMLAIKNGVHNYIVLDCRYSKLEWIKNSILKSEMPTILKFDEHMINWEKCEEYAQKNTVKELCEYYNSNKDISLKDLSEIFHINRNLIGQWLVLGDKHGWCEYSKEDRLTRKANKQIGKDNPVARSVIRLLDNKIYDTVRSAAIENNMSFSWMSTQCKKQKNFMFYDEWMSSQE